MGFGGNEMIKICLFKKAGVLLMIILLVFSTSSLAANTTIQKTATNVKNSVVMMSSTWIVPDDFPTIQKAIDHANPGDTIYVRTGIYFENVLVNKSIFLIGEDKDTTFINGKNYKFTMNITADNVTVSGFTIMYGGYGIHIFHSSYNTIINNILTDNNGDASNPGGICLSYAEHNVIENNVVKNNDWFGIRLVYSSANTVSGNKVSGNFEGIELDFSSDNIITGNEIRRNEDCGIGLYKSNNNTIGGYEWNLKNQLYYNDFGICILWCKYYRTTLKKFNIFTGNRINIFGALPGFQSKPRVNPSSSIQSNPSPNQQQIIQQSNQLIRNFIYNIILRRLTTNR